MTTPGQLSHQAFQRMERFNKSVEEKTDDCMRRGLEGEDTNAEFMDLMRQRNLSFQGMSAMLKLNGKPLQKILDEAR
jgi:hypothetical protein